MSIDTDLVELVEFCEGSVEPFLDNQSVEEFVISHLVTDNILRVYEGDDLAVVAFFWMIPEREVKEYNGEYKDYSEEDDCDVMYINFAVKASWFHKSAGLAIKEAVASSMRDRVRLVAFHRAKYGNLLTVKEVPNG